MDCFAKEGPSVLRVFFSSRRRHTRSLCDWSSDVCSSDLGWVAHVDRPKVGLLEIAVDPVRIGVDEGDSILADSGVVAELRQQIGDVAVDGGDRKSVV